MDKEINRIRNHFSYVLEKTWSVIFVLVIIAFGNLTTVSEGIEMLRKGNFIQGIMMIGGALILLVVIMVWHINRWWRTTLTVKDGTVIYERRTLNRRVNNISVTKISNINLEQNLFEIIMGTYKLKLDTSSMSTAETTDMEIVLRKEQAYRVKNLIMSMIKEAEEESDTAVKSVAQGDSVSGDVDGAGNVNQTADSGHDATAGNESMEARRQVNGYTFDEEDLPFDVVYSVGEVFKNNLVTISVFQVLITLCLVISGFVSFRVMMDDGGNMEEAVGAMLVQLLAAGSIVSAIIKGVLQDYHFRAKREGDKVFVSCGLIKKRNYAVPVEMINAVTLRYTFIGRLCKMAYVKVINVGGEHDDVDGMKFLLAGSYEEIEKRLKLLLPEFTLPELTNIRKPPLRVLVKRWITAGIWTAFASAASLCGMMIAEGGRLPMLAITIWAVGTVAVLAFLLWVCFLSYKVSGLSLEGEDCVISRGTFGKTIVSVPYEKMQKIHLSQGPVERLLSVQSGYVSILASAASRVQSFGTFDKEAFDGIEDKLRETY